ncbi:hypothetical protein BH10ACI1_BH10ACI1_26550 [soil metagenome]
MATSGGGTDTQSVTVKRDAASPNISFVSRTPTANAGGWNNSDVTINWNCSDTASGAIYPSDSQIISTEGQNQSATGTCTDNAGNTASDTQSGINIDKTAPNISFISRTAANANGWNNNNVTVNWSCGDAVSGATNANVNQIISTEGLNQNTTGICEDYAGNIASDMQNGINIDTTAPIISFVSRTTANGNGWNNSNVTVNWSCGDALSGTVNPNDSRIVSAEGQNQSITGTCADNADNAASNTQNSINIDTHSPTLSPVVSLNPVVQNGAATASANASDSLSDITLQSCGAVDTSSVGNQTVNCTATDLAGNTANAVATYQVIANTCGVTINPATLDQPYIEVPYLQLLSARPLGNYTFRIVAGELPPGLRLVSVFGIASIVGVPTTPGNYSFTIGARRNAACEGMQSYTVTVPTTVLPILECIQRNPNNSYTAHFGYENTTGEVVTIPVGANNFFTPGNQNRGQTTAFQTGRVTNAFEVTFNNRNPAVWFVRGMDGMLRPMNITMTTLGCP